MGDLAADLAYSWRRLRKAPAFACVAVLTLALGIGANTALFSVLNGLLFKLTSAPGAERLVTLARVETTTGRILLGLTPDERRAVADSGLFTDLVLRDPLIAAVTDGVQAEVLSAELVSGNYFEVLGIGPTAGRLLQFQDDVVAAADTPVVISDRLWLRWFARDPSTIGRAITVADQRATIVGVVPRGFNGTWVPAILAADVWLPVRVTDKVRTVQGASRGDHLTFATPRVGVSKAQATAALDSIGRQIPGERASRTRLVPLPGRRGMNAQEFDRYGGLLGSAVLGVSALVLLIACANLANLFLARGAGRAGELAIRRAIGANSARLVQLLLAESVVLTFIAGCAALAIVVLATRFLTAMHLPTLEGLSITIDVTPDWRVFCYALGTAFFSTIVSGLLPSRRSVRVNPWSALGSAGTGSTVRHRRGHARLVGTQIAMSLVLLVVAGLYVRSAFQAATFNPGYDMSGLAMASVDFRLRKMTEPQGRVALQRLLEGARTLPAARRAALTTRVPAAGPASFERIGPEEQAPGDGSGLWPHSLEYLQGSSKRFGFPSGEAGTSTKATMRTHPRSRSSANASRHGCGPARIRSRNVCRPRARRSR